MNSISRLRDNLHTPKDAYIAGGGTQRVTGAMAIFQSFSHTPDTP